MSVASAVRVRFAPSPTGFLHLGGLRTALFNYLFALKHQGTFVLRLEDTDQSRLVEGAAERLQSDLSWAGLKVHEGPLQGGDYGPYVQSKRVELYQKYADQLLQSGHAYRCFCSTERLEAVRKLASKVGRSTAYDGHCRYVSAETEAEMLHQSKPYVVRLKVPRHETHEVQHDHTSNSSNSSNSSSNEYSEIVGKVPVPTPPYVTPPSLETLVHDMNYGSVAFDTSAIDDQVLLKSDGFPTYHLANVVDDHHMGITHVLRGEEWLISTAKHVLLYDALGWDPPAFVHLPLLVNPDGSKLSKRNNSLFVGQMREEGALPLALCNYVARLGWSPPAVKENHIYGSMDELAQDFSLERLNKPPAVVDPDRLRYMNRRCLRSVPTMPSASEQARAYLWEHVVPDMSRSRGEFDAKDPDTLLSDDYLNRVLDLASENLDTLAEVSSELRFLWIPPSFSVVNTNPTAIAALPAAEGGNAFAPGELEDVVMHPGTVATLRDSVLSVDDFTADALKAEAKAWTKQNKLKMKNALKTLRYFLTGRTAGPPIFAIMQILGRDRCQQRINAALAALNA